ncbi:MAG: molybdopterin converting factor subunit 1 [Betaproteobacteria bacterium]|nr:molybdopterin converting factor subunit 1 [Betaproteobacteria bacterium]
MNVKVLYFAGLREAVGQSAEQFALPAGVGSVGQLHAYLAARGGAWEALATTKNLRIAVNQNMAAMDTPVKAGDEVAFFPPVTGRVR